MTNRPYNGQKKQDQQWFTKDWATRFPQKTGVKSCTPEGCAVPTPVGVTSDVPEGSAVPTLPVAPVN